MTDKTLKTKEEIIENLVRTYGSDEEFRPLIEKALDSYGQMIREEERAAVVNNLREFSCNSCGGEGEKDQACEDCGSCLSRCKDCEGTGFEWDEGLFSKVRESLEMIKKEIK